MRRIPERAAAALLTVWAAAAAAAAPKPQLEGPITVNADHAAWEQAGRMNYRGNVVLHSEADGLDMRGDQMEMVDHGRGQFEAHITGDPVKMHHDATDVQPEVNAQARGMTYDSATGIVKLESGAWLTRGSDHMSGEHIRYDVNNRRIDASGKDGAQVRIVITPPPPKKKNSGPH